jgi:hypothetical protein
MYSQCAGRCAAVNICRLVFTAVITLTADRQQLDAWTLHPVQRY